MDDDLLAMYLNDHLAGAVFAIELGEHSRSRHADGPASVFLGELLHEVREDQAILREVMSRVGAKESAVKKAGAWISEKAGELTLRGSRPRQVAFLRMQELEALLGGVRGKLALWDALEAISAADARLAGFDWGELKRRATDQIERINARRIEAAREAFVGAGSRDA